jgi:flagellin
MSGIHRTFHSDSAQCPDNDSSRKENSSGLDSSIRDLLETDMSEFGQGVRKANSAISEIQIADRALLSIGDKLLKMKEYARSSADKDCSPLDRKVIEKEYQKVALEITEIASLTDGFDSNGICNDVRKATAAELGLGTDAGPQSAGYTISTREAAMRAVDGVSDAIVKKDSMRSRLGTLKKSLESTISSLVVKAQNIQAAETRLSDIDVANEMAVFVKQQILTKSKVAILSQACRLSNVSLSLVH